MANKIVRVKVIFKLNSHLHRMKHQKHFFVLNDRNYNQKIPTIFETKFKTLSTFDCSTKHLFTSNY